MIKLCKHITALQNYREKKEKMQCTKGIKMSEQKKRRGRKAIDGEKINNNLTIRFSDKELEEIEELAKKLDMPKTRLVRNMALAGLEDAKMLDKIGALKGAQKLMDFKERLLNPGRYKTLYTAS